MPYSDMSVESETYFIHINGVSEKYFSSTWVKVWVWVKIKVSILHVIIYGAH